MASRLMGFLQIVAFVTVLFSGTTLADVKVNANAEPSTVIKGLTDTVTISCKLKDTDGLKVLLAIKLDKVNGNITDTLATILPGAKAAEDQTNNTHWKFEGKLDSSNAISSFLNLIIPDPTTEDAGQYICVMIYLDATYQPTTVKANITLKEKDAEPDELAKEVSDLGDAVEKLAKLEKSVKELNGTVTDLKNKGGGGCTCDTTDLKNSTTKLEKKVADLEIKMAGMENTTSDNQVSKREQIITDQLEKQQNRTKELEEKVSKLMEKLEGGRNATSAGETGLKAQEKLITEQGKQLSEQKNLTMELEKTVTKLEKKSGEHSKTLLEHDVSIKAQGQAIAGQIEQIGKQRNDTMDLEEKVSDLENVTRQQNSALKEMKKNTQDQSKQLNEKVSDLEKTASEQNSTITELKQRAQEKAKQLEEQISDLKDEASDQNSTIIDMKQKNLKQVAELKKMVSDLEEEFMQQNVTVFDQAKTMGVLGQLVAGLGARINNLTGSVQDSPVSAFSAGFSSGTKVSLGGTLPFGDVLLNMGNHYNTTTGVYTAQWDGLYVFHLSALISQKQGGKADIQLVVNDMKKVASLYDKVLGDQAALTAVVNLKAGDTVKPTANSGSNSVSPLDHYSLFSGYLLKPL